MCNWDAGGHEGDRGVPPPPHPSDAPAPQNPTYVLVWWSGRSEALGMGGKHQRGQNTPPSGASSPLTPIGTPVTPKSAQGGGPRPIRTRAHAARRGPPDPTAEEKLPHPIIQSVPKLHKTIRHPGRPVYPPLLDPPCGGTDASKTPTPEPGPSACTNPCSRRHTNQDPSPPGPAVTPTRRQSAPRSPNPPPGPTPEQYGRQAGNLRPPAQASPAAPHAAARETASRVTNTPSRPGGSPSAEPPRNPPPGNPQMPQAHMPPHANHKNHSRTESGPPPTLGDGADQRSPERLI